MGVGLAFAKAQFTTSSQQYFSLHSMRYSIHSFMLFKRRKYLQIETIKIKVDLANQRK
ncbi:hypothetical protein DDD_3314 [Nonlabens dokdonensis DSW-6]|uniref:Uncharacterized protein n=1 Tax=Nonlabens dokdonensis (strain DSM 17205 / KCTC 12402 / DSW-6) TaxID=592029 RepID=L7WES9_NONDD|nr:hypothetical protein DDD_3314 [Nonlabens dokdonensis DSW-6]